MNFVNLFIGFVFLFNKKYNKLTIRHGSFKNPLYFGTRSYWIRPKTLSFGKEILKKVLKKCTRPGSISKKSSFVSRKFFKYS